jgi:predicted DNA-binding mobile mystery protein A
MKEAIRHLDKRFAKLRVSAGSARPPKGWVRAIRDALGMTTAQLARRIGVSQPRVVELEQAEVSGSITLRSLQRAAEALDCRLVYALIPQTPLEGRIRERAEALAARHSGAVEHSMLLEGQAVDDAQMSRQLHRQRVEDLLRKPARLWDNA